MVETSVPKPAPGSYNSIAAQYARAKAAKDAEDQAKAGRITKQNGLDRTGKPKSVAERLDEFKKRKFGREWGWVVGFFCWLS